MRTAQADALREELRRRLEQLEESAHTNSECFAPTRRILIEAALWLTAAAVIWLVTLRLT
jgi:hypothetical protein